MNDCIFCKIISGDVPSYKVYEDDDILAFLDITPVNAGHTLVIPKKHYNNLEDLPEEETNKIIRVIKKIIPAVISGTKADGFNLSINNGAVAGQIVGHAHFHIVPRHNNDGYELWHGKEYGAGEADQILEKIKTGLN